MSQEHEEPTTPTDDVQPAAVAPLEAGEIRPSEDPWASLAALEEDVATSVVDDVAAAAAETASAVTSTTLAPVPVDDLPDEIAEQAGDDASAAAELNESAVQAAVETAVGQTEASLAPEPVRGGLFTIPLLCAGIAIIAACLLIPQADANRRLAYERLKLQADLEAVNRQVDVNDEFLGRINEDANLAERLAQRQMKIIRKGNEVLKLGKESDGMEMSPFQLTAVPLPPELPPYQPRGGPLAKLCYDAKSRLYLIGAGLMAVASGLVLGIAPKPD